MDIEVLGSGREIGRSCIVVTFADQGVEARVMLDCGVHMNHKENESRYPDFRKYLKLPQDTSNENVGKLLSEKIDAVLVTHMHLDHLGAVPYLTEKLKYSGPVIMSSPTKGLGSIVLADFFRNMSDSDPQNNDSYTCTPADVLQSLNRATVIQLRETLRIVPKRLGKLGFVPPLASAIQIKAHLAGHVLGGVMFEVKYAGRSVIYTGDFNTSTDRLIARADVPQVLRPDALICEGTYAILTKDNRSNVEREMCRIVLATLRAGGKVLVPCFAVGKAQEIASCLIEFLRECKVSYPLIIGGLMMSRANEQYRDFAEWSRGVEEGNMIRHKHADSLELAEDVQFGGSAILPMHRLATEIVHLDTEENFLKSSNPGVLFAAPAMMTGGLSLTALKEWAGNPKNLIVMTGSCVPGSIGNKLVIGNHTETTSKLGVSGHKSISIVGTRNNSTTSNLTISCKVRYFPFANHAGYFGLKRTIERVDPNCVVFVHGDAEGILTMGQEIARDLGIPVWCPKNFESFKVACNPSPPPMLSVTGCPDDGVVLLGRIGGLKFAHRVSNDFLSCYINVPLSLRQLLTDPPLWPELIPWLSSVSLNDDDDPMMSNPDDFEDGEMLEEEGYVPDDEHMVAATVTLNPSSGASQSVKFGDSRHEALFKLALNKTSSQRPNLVAGTAHYAPETVEAKLNSLSRKRHVSKISGWVVLNQFRDVVAAMESMNGANGNFAYYENKGYGVLVFHALAMTAVVALNPTAVISIAHSYDKSTQSFRHLVTSKKLSKLSKTKPQISDQFITPLLIQVGKLELQILMHMAKSEEDVPLRFNFWKLLTKLFINPNKVQPPEPRKVAETTVTESDEQFSDTPTTEDIKPPAPKRWKSKNDDWTRSAKPATTVQPIVPTPRPYQVVPPPSQAFQPAATDAQASPKIQTPATAGQQFFPVRGIPPPTSVVPPPLIMQSGMTPQPVMTQRVPVVQPPQSSVYEKQPVATDSNFNPELGAPGPYAGYQQSHSYPTRTPFVEQPADIVYDQQPSFDRTTYTPTQPVSYHSRQYEAHDEQMRFAQARPPQQQYGAQVNRGAPAYSRSPCDVSFGDSGVSHYTSATPYPTTQAHYRTGSVPTLYPQQDHPHSEKVQLSPLPTQLYQEGHKPREIPLGPGIEMPRPNQPYDRKFAQPNINKWESNTHAQQAPPSMQEPWWNWQNEDPQTLQHGASQQQHTQSAQMQQLFQSNISHKQTPSQQQQLSHIRQPPQQICHHQSQSGHLGPPQFNQPPGGHHGQAPVGHHGQPLVGHHGQPPVGHLGQPPVGHHGQPPVGHHGQPPVGHHGQPPGHHGQPPLGHHGQPPVGHHGQPPVGHLGQQTGMPSHQNQSQQQMQASTLNRQRVQMSSGQHPPVHMGMQGHHSYGPKQHVLPPQHGSLKQLSEMAPLDMTAPGNAMTQQNYMGRGGPIPLVTSAQRLGGSGPSHGPEEQSWGRQPSHRGDPWEDKSCYTERWQNGEGVDVYQTHGNQSLIRPNNPTTHEHASREWQRQGSAGDPTHWGDQDQWQGSPHQIPGSNEVPMSGNVVPIAGSSWTRENDEWSTWPRPSNTIESQQQQPGNEAPWVRSQAPWR